MFDKQTKKDVVSGSLTYRGSAEAGTATSAKGWQIERETVSGTETSILLPIGKEGNKGVGFPSTQAEFAWDDREDLAYSETNDTTTPELTTVTIVSDNGDPTKAGVNNVLTLTIVGNKYLDEVIMTIAGHSVTAVKGADNMNFTGTYTMVTSDTAGVVPFTVEVKDIAGHGSGVISVTSDVTYVTFDKIIPTATLLYSVDGGSNYYSTLKVKDADTLRIKATFSEALADSPVVKIAIDNGIRAAIAMTKTSTTVYYYDLNVPVGNVATATCSMSIGKDVSGNVVVAVPTNATFTVDNTAPVFTGVSVLSNNADTARAKSGNIVTAIFTTSEVLGGNPTVTLGAQAMTFSTLVGSTYTYTRTIDGSETEGTCNVLVTGSDVAGNTTTNTNVGNITSDFTAPTLSSAAKNTVTQITVTLSELGLASSITKANDGGFVVTETSGVPTYAVASIAPGATNDLVVLTVADMTASATAGVTVTYVNAANGTVSDRAGNALATDATGVVIAGW